MRYLLLGLSFWLGSMAAEAAWFFNKQDVVQLHHAPADHRVAYGSDPLQFGELRLPKGPGPYPVAIIVHGGCWLSQIATHDTTEAFADALRDQGVATWNIEYRQVDNPGGGFPGTFQDVGHAADYLRQLAPKYQLDLKRVVAVGHSAGGQLALWLAGRHKLPQKAALYMPEPLPLRGVVSLGGVPDLKLARKPAMTVCGNTDVIGRLLGSTVPNMLAVRYQEASPIDLLPLDMPQVLVYGQNDQVVPMGSAQGYVAAAKQKGETVTVLQPADTAHFEYIVPNSVAWVSVRDAILRLLR